MTKKAEDKAPEATKSDLGAEFAALGQSIREALNAAWSSEQRHNFQGEIVSGMRNVADEFEKAAQNIRESDAAQSVEGRVQQTRDNLQSGKVADDLRDAVAKALRSTSEAIDEMSNSFRPIDVDNGDDKKN